MATMKRPSVFLTALEGRRALDEFYAYWVACPVLQTAPQGDGHPVMVIPGFMASDLTTVSLRTFLKSRGYAAYGWGLGPNDGRDIHPIHGLASDHTLLRRLRRLKAEHGRKVSLIGWSFGGVYAREMARLCPDDVRVVITLGSPFTGEPRANNVYPIFEYVTGYKADEVEPGLRQRFKQPPPVPATAIYSRTDGIVAWECCIEQTAPTTENIGILSSHAGLGHNPLALWAIADRLAQPEGKWRRFDRTGLKSVLFGDPTDTRGLW
jgi:pimeloyl-ACP methyl ester carboxylesterase